MLEVLCVSRISLIQVLNIINNEGLLKLKTIICFDELTNEELSNLIPITRRQDIQILLFSKLINLTQEKVDEEIGTT